MKRARASLLLAQKEKHQQLVSAFSQGRDLQPPSFSVPSHNASFMLPSAHGSLGLKKVATFSKAKAAAEAEKFLDDLLSGPSMAQAKMLEYADPSECEFGTCACAAAVKQRLPCTLLILLCPWGACAVCTCKHLFVVTSYLAKIYASPLT